MADLMFDPNEDKIEIMKLRVSMSPIEKEAFENFVRSDAAKKYVDNKEIAEEKRAGRKTLLENTAIKELMYLRSIDSQRQQENRPLLTKEDYRLSLSEGVVISRYREKERRQDERQAEKDRTTAALEAMGGRPSDTHDF